VCPCFDDIVARVPAFEGFVPPAVQEEPTGAVTAGRPRLHPLLARGLADELGFDASLCALMETGDRSRPLRSHPTVPRPVT
jgi:hypothetical protein